MAPPPARTPGTRSLQRAPTRLRQHARPGRRLGCLVHQLLPLDAGRAALGQQQAAGRHVRLAGSCRGCGAVLLAQLLGDCLGGCQGGGLHQLLRSIAEHERQSQLRNGRSVTSTSPAPASLQLPPSAACRLHPPPPPPAVAPPVLPRCHPPGLSRGQVPAHLDRSYQARPGQATHINVLRPRTHCRHRIAPQWLVTEERCAREEGQGVCGRQRDRVGQSARTCHHQESPPSHPAHHTRPAKTTVRR